MFLETKTDGEARAPDLWDKARIIAWLASKPANGEYCYVSNGHCLIAQWLRANGWRDPNVTGGPYVQAREGLGELQKVPRWLWHVSRDQPRTFGAALARAKGALE